MLMIVLFGVMTLFVCGVAAAALGSRIWHPVALVANLLLIGLLFGLGHAMGVTPGTPAGGGNPALILAVPLAALGLVLIGQIYVWVHRRRFGPILLAVLLLGLTAHQAAAFELQRIRYRGLRERIAETAAANGRRDVWNYVDAVTAGPASMQMNPYYFHFNTYLLFVGGASMIAVVLLLAKALGTDRREGRK